MHVVGFCGPSGVGKTTLVERLVAELKARGQRVSVIKHAHKTFDIDHVGKDTWRHRQAGAYEVMIASGHRLAKMREYETVGQPSVHQLIAEMQPCDWLLVEGFKQADIPKVEVWREALLHAPIYPGDAQVVAVATDAPASLPWPTALPVLDMADVRTVASFLLDNSARFAYPSPHHG